MLRTAGRHRPHYDRLESAKHVGRLCNGIKRRRYDPTDQRRPYDFSGETAEVVPEVFHHYRLPLIRFAAGGL